MMKTRSFDVNADYDEVKSWWKKQGWPAIPVEFLGVNGYIAEKDGQKIAATWIYRLQDSPWALMEWTVGNPDASWEDRSVALKMVTDTACAWAKENGASKVFTMTKSARFMDKLIETGFIKTDSEMTHLMRSL